MATAEEGTPDLTDLPSWLYRESIEDGAPEWLLVTAAREIERLRWLCDDVYNGRAPISALRAASADGVMPYGRLGTTTGPASPTCTSSDA